MRPGVVGRLGLDYEALAAVNPDLIYCSISGFGQTGPWSKKMTYDPLVQSSTGMVAAQGRPESQSKRHSLYNGLIVDKTTAMTASQAILAALYARDAKGRGGQHIDLSMYDVGFAYNWVVRCSAPASAAQRLREAGLLCRGRICSPTITLRTKA